MAAANMEAFEAYFRRADLDRDGRISGLEAVSFFQGSNLPKQVLAQIWTHADQNRVGFLGRAEFFNFLRLATVAQRGRELTPDIVKAVLYGPDAVKIPAPQINAIASPGGAPQPRPPVPVPSSAPAVVGSGGPRAPGVTANTQGPQLFPSAGGHVMRPQQSTPAPVLALEPAQGVARGIVSGGSIAVPRTPGSSTPNLVTDWLGNRGTGVSVRGPQPSPGQDGLGLSALGAGVGTAPKSSIIPSSTSSSAQKPLESSLLSVQPDDKNSKPSGNGFVPDSVFGDDLFSAIPQAKQGSFLTVSTNDNPPNVPVRSTLQVAPQNPLKTGDVDMPGKPPLPPGVHLQHAQSFAKQSQLDKAQNFSASSASNVSVAHAESQISWPKFAQSDIQKYTSVFVKVDKDRDGKITGDEARNLFLSWKLPREVLKQVWDLSDQDNDSMLSLREFCYALYLMERFREGRRLPTVLPNSIKFDEILLLSTSQQQMPGHGGTIWQPSPGLVQQGIPLSNPVVQPPRVRPPVGTSVSSQREDAELSMQQKSKVPVLEKNLVDQLSKEEQNVLNSKFQETTDAEKKVQELEKEIQESKERTEFYRSKMQELVLYKSRCDSRLNEITERISADRREIELLAKKYEAKCKEIGGDLASKLTLGEATFRDIQGRKMELYNAIAKIEQGGSDDTLKDRADNIQSDLEELMKVLSERCKQYGLRAKPSSLIELPFGWQPSIQEGASDWSEDWDRFDDEGFAVIKELTVEAENIVATSSPKPSEDQSVETTKDEGSKDVEHVAFTIDNKLEKPLSNGDGDTKIESVYAPSDDESVKSLPESPAKSTTTNQSPELKPLRFDMHDSSPRNKSAHSEHGAESSISGDKSIDEPHWGARFDVGDDADSVWGFSTKDNDYEKNKLSSFFDSGDFGLNPVGTDSPSAASMFGKEKNPLFDSVPSTPMFNSGSSPPNFNEGPDHSFSTFGRFDSFNTHDGSLFPPRESLARFDSFSSTSGHGQNESLARFDSFSTTAGHGRNESLVRFDSIRSTTDGRSESLARFDSFQSTSYQGWGDNFGRFDSFHSTADNSMSFPYKDDADPLGTTGPSKSLESHSSRRGSDNWSAF